MKNPSIRKKEQEISNDSSSDEFDLPIAVKKSTTMRMSAFYSHNMNDVELKKQLSVVEDSSKLDSLKHILRMPAKMRT